MIAFETNATGTKNLLNTGVPVLLSSTCKAISPETVYGASKLIAERMVLNYGGTVIRYVNILEAGPSVYDIWGAVPEEDALPIMDCHRYLITRKEAIALTVWGMVLSPGRYKINAGDPVHMSDLAERMFPERDQVYVPRRRGDRVDEPHHAPHEVVVNSAIPGIERIIGYHDDNRTHTEDGRFRG
jgi:FlaA1/EpsC-like NDP-sugar epimerase